MYMGNAANRKRTIVFACVAVILIVGAFIILKYNGHLFNLFGKQDVKESNSLKQNLSSQYAGEDCDVALFGDSLTAGGDFQAYFPDVRICNLGVPGDTLQGMNERAYLLEMVKPEKVFILGGINSLRNDNYDSTLNEYKQMVNTVCEIIHADIFLLSILPLSEEKSLTYASNPTITRFNADIASFAKQE